MGDDLEQLQAQQAALHEQMNGASEAEQISLAANLGTLAFQQKKAKEEEEEENKNRDAPEEEQQRGFFGSFLGVLGDLIDTFLAKAMESMMESITANVRRSATRREVAYEGALALGEVRGMEDPERFANYVSERVGAPLGEESFEEAVNGVIEDSLAYSQAAGKPPRQGYAPASSDSVTPTQAIDRTAAEAADRERGAQATSDAWSRMDEMSKDELREAIGPLELQRMADAGVDRMGLADATIAQDTKALAEQGLEARASDRSSGGLGKLNSPKTPGHESPLDRIRASRQERDGQAPQGRG